MHHHATPISPIDRLAKLAAQRTARTDRLHDAVISVLNRLEAHAEVDAAVTVDGYTLRLVHMRSNLGYENFWSFESYDDDDWVHIEQPVGSESYLHGDFHAVLRGPSRAHLIAFGQRAERFVHALLSRELETLAELASAQASVESAAQALAPGEEVQS